MTQAAAQSSASASADVIVVGAGPAGSSAAYHMATLGLDVILLEKQELGRDKVCGDGLTPSAVRELVSMGMDATGWQRNRGLRVIGGGHLLHFPWPEQASFPSYGMARPRALLDRDLAVEVARPSQGERGERLLEGVRRIVGDVAEAVPALIPHLKTDRSPRFLQAARKHYARRERDWTNWPGPRRPTGQSIPRI